MNLSRLNREQRFGIVLIALGIVGLLAAPGPARPWGGPMHHRFTAGPTSAWPQHHTFEPAGPPVNP